MDFSAPIRKALQSPCTVDVLGKWGCRYMRHVRRGLLREFVRREWPQVKPNLRHLLARAKVAGLYSPTTTDLPGLETALRQVFGRID